MKTKNQKFKMLGVRFEAALAPDGTPFLNGITYSSLPKGVEIIGNGTIPHPLSVKLTGDYANIAALVEVAKAAQEAREWMAANATSVQAERDIYGKLATALAKLSSTPVSSLSPKG